MKKKRYLILLLAVLIAAVVSIFVINKKIKIAPVFADRYEITGVDVSHYQGTIDWEKLAAQNLDFAFIKATEGASFIDECFYDNWKEAEKTELCVGAYHFFSFDSDGEKQAQFYIDTVGNLNGKMAPAVDVEFYGDKQSNPPEKDEVVEQLNKLLDTLEEYYQIKPVIYTTYTVYNSYIKGEFEDYPLWIRNAYYQPLLGTRGKWTFWQYTDTAVLEGYEGEEKYIDRNVFRGTREELQELIVQCGEENVSEEDTVAEEDVPLEHCNLIYNTAQVKVYSYLGQIRTLFILTPESETVISPVENFWFDEEQEAVWLLENKEDIQIRKVDLRQEHFLEETLLLDREAMELLLADTYGLLSEEGNTVFRDLDVDFYGRKSKNGETYLRGCISGVDKETMKEFEIAYEIESKSSKINVKGYLQKFAFSPLYQEFLLHNLTVENPFVESETRFGKNLSFFDDEIYLSESGNFRKRFATADIDGDGEQEFLFDLKQIEGIEEFVYVLAPENGRLVCRDILNTAPVEDAESNTIRWFDCASFIEIPAENCKEYKSRDEVFSAIEVRDFSVVERKYADPHYGLEEVMDFAEEMAYVLEKAGGKTRRCDIDGDGFDELLILVQYDNEEYERIDFILDYRNGKAVCLYYDWCDGGEWLILGDAGKLIHCSRSFTGACTYYGFYECTLNARGIKEIDYTGYGIDVCNVYESGDAGFWWWKGQEPEITQTGMYYIRCGKKLITKEQFLQEYKKLTGAEFALDFEYS